MDVFDFLRQPGFQRGLLLGMGAAALAALVSITVSRRSRPGPFAGLAFATAGTAGVFLIEHPSRWLAAGIAALFVGGLLSTVLPPLARLALAVPGAWLLAGPAVPTAEPWARALVGAAIVIGAALVSEVDLRWRAHGVGVAMLAITMLGIYATVPDTEEALVLLGVTVPVALLGFPLGVARLGAVGAATAVGLLGWTIAYGGRARETAIVGGVACLGMFVVEPLAVLLRRGARPSGGWSQAVWLLAAHLAMVFTASRIVGVREQLAVAVAGALALGVAAVIGIMRIPRPAPAPLEVRS